MTAPQGREPAGIAIIFPPPSGFCSFSGRLSPGMAPPSGEGRQRLSAHKQDDCLGKPTATDGDTGD